MGSFLGGLFRTITPLLTSGAKAIGKEGLRTSINMLSDFTNTVPTDQAIRTRMKEFTSNLKRKADDKLDRVMKGSGYKKKKPNVATQSLQRLLAVHHNTKENRRKTSGQKKRKKSANRARDIFD